MASYPDYVPAPDADFDNWLQNFDALLTGAPTDFGLTAPDAVVVAGVAATWFAAYNLAIDPPTRTPVTVAAKDAARAAAEGVVRPYAVSISLNPAVDPGDKVAIGVTLRSEVPTPIPAPTTAPELGLQSIILGQATLTFKEVGGVGKSKPFGVVGLEVRRTLGVAPAVDPAAALSVGIFTKSPWRLPNSSGDAGKVQTVFARWITRSGPSGVSQSGPWAAPLSWVIPG